MKALILTFGVVLALAGCDPVEHCPGKEVCGQGCMPVGASCCPDGEHYCDEAGTYCGTDNACHFSSGGGGGGTCPVNTCINNLCSPGLWCCNSACSTSTCGCR